VCAALEEAEGGGSLMTIPDVGIAEISLSDIESIATPNLMERVYRRQDIEARWGLGKEQVRRTVRILKAAKLVSPWRGLCGAYQYSERDYAVVNKFIPFVLKYHNYSEALSQFARKLQE
ncbi:unnamed protein product, partial [marine sediment metagenome]